MICVIDYGAGNLKSVVNALNFLGCDVTVSADKDVILKADKVILPGVGSFGDAMQSLEKACLVEVIKQVISSGKPFMGICLGMQLLFEGSEECPGVKGLGVFKGSFKKFNENKEAGIRVPQIGWNSLDITNGFFDDFKNQYVYFVHSFYLPESEAEDKSIIGAETFFGENYICAVEKDNIVACQFHPEKSGDIGLGMLKKFIAKK